MNGGIYALDTAHGQQELLSDVAAFANARDGGLLLVGFSTRVENGQEVIDQVQVRASGGGHLHGTRIRLQPEDTCRPRSRAR